MTPIYLVVTGADTQDRRLTCSNDVRDAMKQGKGASCRISPIFPVIPEECDKNPLGKKRIIGFFCPLKAFDFIGKQPGPIKKELWFSHGIASVIRFAEDQETVLSGLSDQMVELAAYEIWEIDENTGRITVLKTWVRNAKIPDAEIGSFKDLPKDVRRLLEEIQMSIHEIIRCYAIYMPGEIVKLQRIIESVNELIAELRYYEAPESSPLPAHFEKKKYSSKDKTSYHQRLNLNLSYLIQLNSALAYVLSQTSNGSVPILERPCLISTYSLLGVGTAYRAVSAVAEYVESVFEKHAILSAIDNIYRVTPGVDIFPDAIRYKMEDWRKSGIQIDKFVQKSTERTRHKLAFFSARLGFGEAHFSVTAASQVLHAADSVRWSMMTLTHELLHSHVTGILATIFGEGESSSLSQASFEKYHEQFKKYVAEYKAEEKKAKPLPKLLDGLRYVIFNFAIFRHSALRKARSTDGSESKPGGNAPKLPEDADLFKSIHTHSLRLLEEIIVHTLDLKYFYRGDSDLFLELLWESWTTVPAVVGDLETYLLRSIVTVATLDQGSVAERYRSSKERLILTLQKLEKRNPTNIFLTKAREHLENEEKSKRLMMLFYSAIYLADMASIFLSSDQIQTEFWDGDDNIEPGTHVASEYALETGSFNGEKVTNPIPFLASRLRYEANGLLDEDYRSAWLLLATASASKDSI